MTMIYNFTTQRLEITTGTYSTAGMYAADIAATVIDTHALNAGGSGYAVNDTFTIDGGSITLATGTVLTVDGGGAVLTYSLSIPGDGYSVTTATTTATLGTGSGLTIDITATRGWNMIQKDGSYNYTFKCALYCTGDSRVHIGYTTHEVVTFDYTTAPNAYFFYFNSTNYCLIGRSDDAAYQNNHGAVIQMRNVPSAGQRIYIKGLVRLSNATFLEAYYFYLYGLDADNHAIVRNSNFVDIQFGLAVNANVDFYNSMTQGGYYGLQPAGIGTVDGLLIERCNIGVLQGTYNTALNLTFKNLKMGYVATGKYTYIRVARAEKHIKYVDSQIPTTGLGWYTSGSYSGVRENEQTLQSTFTFKVTDEEGTAVEGATIKVYNDQDELIYTGTSDENGEATEILDYFMAWRYYLSGVLTSSGEISYQPFKTIITMEGYENQTMQGITVVDGVPTIINATINPIINMKRSIDGKSYAMINPELGSRARMKQL